MLRNREIILDERPELIVINAANDTVQSSLFAVIFSAIRLTLESNARYFVLPMALMGDTIRAIAAVSDWFDAKNKNFRKTFRLFLEAAKLIVVATAIIGSLAGCIAIAAVTPFLFIAAIGSSTLYHIALSFSHGYKWATAKGPEEAKHHKKHFFGNLLGAVAGAAVTVAISVLLAFKPELGIANFVIATVATVMSGISAMVASFNGLSYFRNRKKNMEVSPDLPGNDYQPHKENSHSQVSISLSSIPNGHSHAVANGKVSTKVNDLEEPLNGEVVDIAIDITDKIDLFHADLINDMRSQDEANKLNYVNAIIDNKIADLELETGNVNLFYPNKQLIKISALKMLKQLVNDGKIVVDNDTQINSLQGLLKHLDEKKIRGTVMNSFLKDVGDVQKIFLLANAYLVDLPVVSNTKGYAAA